MRAAPELCGCIILFTHIYMQSVCVRACVKCLQACVCVCVCASERLRRHRNSARGCHTHRRLAHGCHRFHDARAHTRTPWKGAWNTAASSRTEAHRWEIDQREPNVIPGPVYSPGIQSHVSDVISTPRFNTMCRTKLIRGIQNRPTMLFFGVVAVVVVQC